MLNSDDERWTKRKLNAKHSLTKNCYQHDSISVNLSIDNIQLSEASKASGVVVVTSYLKCKHAFSSFMSQFDFESIYFWSCSTKKVQLQKLIMKYFYNDPRYRPTKRHYLGRGAANLLPAGALDPNFRRLQVKYQIHTFIKSYSKCK